MDFAKLYNTLITGIIGIIGYLFGDINGLLVALLIAMSLDFVTGIIVAVVKHELSSNICGKGIAKKVLMLCIVVVGHLVDSAVIGEGAAIQNLVVIFYLANECISLLENSARLGVKYPDKLIKILEQLREGNNGRT
nr:MAG TPA: holin [Caudoviricetes sp.]